MRKLLFIVSFLVCKLALQAQLYGNEWIDYNQVHYKIKVAADGLYRIPYSVLFPNVGSLPASSFIMYHNGQVVPIYTSTNSNLQNGDYIDFIGKHNDGSLETELYKADSLQPHTYYSLFTDTSIYYLTVKLNASNPRFTTISNNLTNLPPQENYFMYQAKQFYTGTYMGGNYVIASGEQVFKSIFDAGEGYANSNWFGSFAGSGQVAFQNLSVNTPAVYTGGPNATFKSVFANYSPGEIHNAHIQLNLNYVYNETDYYNPLPKGFKLNKVSTPVPTSILVNGNNSIVYSVTSNSASSQQNMVYLNEIDYPRSFDFGGQNTFFFTLEADAVNRKYIVITNFNDNGLQPFLYDITNGLIIQSTATPGSNPRFALPPSATPRELYLISGDPSTINTVNNITPIAFQRYDSLTITNQADYLIITDSTLDAGDIDGDGFGEVTDYQRYRDMNASPSTGRYNARIFSIEQLYDQFAYGVRKSPLAIRNLIRYGLAKWTIKPKYVLLMGKGREYQSIRNDAAASKQCLVPTFGSPGSDNLLAATRLSDIPTVAIGRIAANTPQQVRDYLDKIKDYETQQNIPAYSQTEDIPDKIWQKQVLHFSGGSNYFEQTLFAGYLSNYQRIVQDTSWGAHVTSYSKTGSDPISQTMSQIIKSQINTGVSLITFFGHSATGAFDFSIDEPENYTNFHKFPVILSNGCFSGFIHDAQPGFSERFVLEPKIGAIAFMATSSLSTSGALNNFSFGLYNNLSVKKYFDTWGNCVKQDLTDIFTGPNANDDNTQMVSYEMTLHGDPALQLNQYPKPDYALAQLPSDASSVFFTPSTITPGLDSFNVNVIVTNLGKAIKDSISVSLTRTVFDPGNNNAPVNFPYKKYIKAPYYIDTITFRVPTRIGTLGYGENRFSPYLDADYHVDEMAEGNNGLVTPVSINIQSDDVVPIYPYEFAIDSDKVVTLKASTTNPFAPVRTYDFDIDTTELFTHPVSGRVTQGGGVLHFTPNITYHDSVVYYWRVKIDTASATRWHNTSFEHINGQYGWNQSHYFQYKKDDYVTLQLDSTDRTFKFPATLNNIHVLTGWADADYGGPVPYETLGWDLNNSDMYRFRMGSCGFLDGITFAVIDTVKGIWQSFNNDNDNFGDKYFNAHCSQHSEAQYGFDFFTTPTVPTGVNPNNPNYTAVASYTWSQLIKRFIDSIPTGAYVLIYSTNKPNYTQWDATLTNALVGLGFADATNFQTGVKNGPFIFFTQKGNTTLSQSFATPGNTFNTGATGLQASINFNARWFKGFMTSPLIGPARSWSRMQWRRHALETNTTDVDTVDIYGVSATGQQTLLQSTVINDNNISTISATQYPYLQLRMRTEDDLLRTPTQLNYWRVIYQKAPEAAINPAAHFVFTDSLSIGGTLKLELGLENVTKIKMDSMLVKYNLRDASFSNYTSYIRHSPLPGLDTLVLQFSSTLMSSSFIGLDKLTVEANPSYSQNGVYDQLEQFHFNNFAEINFNTIGDKSNPLLDVTFDGQHIFNGDIVSAKPDILVTLRDNSKYFALNDTSNIAVFIEYPNSTTPVRIPYDNQILKFYPADSTNLSKGNKAQAEFKPTQLADGVYQLLVKDQNRAGKNSSTTPRNEANQFYDYKISFEVVNKPMITNVLNYPNPFTTSTKFVFTVTGSEVPDILKIQIMNIKGTVVKEITKEELGPINIGRNITQYSWDGRDQYGDLLANGVYFYRVATRLDGKKMDQMNMSYDKYFKHGFGKMVILR